MMLPESFEVLAEHAGVQLIRNAHGEDEHRFEVTEPVDVDDLRRSFHAHDELITAIDTYHECLVRAMPSAIAPVLQLLHRFNRAMTDGDADVMGRLLADDFRLVDHVHAGTTMPRGRTCSM